MPNKPSGPSSRCRTLLKGVAGGAVLAGVGTNVGLGSLVAGGNSEAAPPVTWTRTYDPRTNQGDDRQDRNAVLHAVLEAPDGGYVLGGYHWRYEDGEVDDVLLLKTDAKGDP